MKIIEFFIWVAVGLLLIWFFQASSILKISIGIAILILILVRDSFRPKSKNLNLEKAAHETFYDAVKWIAFGIFVVIYPSFLKSNTTALLVTILIFTLVLYGLNVLKERNSPKR